MRTVLFSIFPVLALFLATTILAEADAEAKPGAENKPLLECYEKAETRLDVGPCLDEKLVQAKQALSDVATAMKKQMTDLAEVTGRLDPVLAFDGAQREFETYRAINCAWYFELMSPGTGAGDAQKACQIKLTRYRTQELRDLLPDSPD